MRPAAAALAAPAAAVVAGFCEIAEQHDTPMWCPLLLAADGPTLASALSLFQGWKGALRLTGVLSAPCLPRQLPVSLPAASAAPDLRSPEALRRLL